MIYPVCPLYIFRNAVVIELSNNIIYFKVGNYLWRTNTHVVLQRNHNQTFDQGLATDTLGKCRICFTRSLSRVSSTSPYLAHQW
jgi:hypothetical protein